ncbi:MAG TPA: sodium:proton antiporter [Bryobacteraceae bacterium]
MSPSIEGTAVLLLLVAAVVAIASQRVRLPYSAGLVIAGIVLSLLPFTPQVGLTRELLFRTLLPPLIFEAALSLRWSELRRDLGVVVALACIGVAISAAITATGMHAVAQWPWMSAVIFGILIAATDPVSVIAIFGEAGVKGRLRLLVEAESLFNDGTAAVGFAIAVSFATGMPMTGSSILSAALTTIAGGLFCGALVAGIMLGLAGRTEDHLVELTFTTVSAYGSFILAEHFHASGVLATLTAGLLMGNVGRLRVLSERGKVAVTAFWEFMAFLANSLIFLLIGMQQARLHLREAGIGALLAIGLVLLGRAGAVYPTSLLFRGSSRRVTWNHQHVLFWGGLRGGLALALALGLPEQLPFRAEIVTFSFAVTAFSIFVQGLTMRPFLRAVGEIPRRNGQGSHASPAEVE